MLIGQSLLTSNSGDPFDYYGPWLPRGGDAATFIGEVLLASGSFTLDIVVQHKNSEDPDSAASPAVTFSSITSATTASASGSGFKELMRYKYSLSSIDSMEWIHMRMNPPIWQPN